MSSYGLPLFRGRGVLPRYVKNLPTAAYQAIGEMLNEEDRKPKDRTQEVLLSQLRARFLLWPLQPAGLVSTVVGRRSIHLGPNGERRGYLVQGNVPYLGSKLLWKVSPTPGFTFPFKARVGAKAIKLCCVLDDQDIAPFTAVADKALAELDEALLALKPLLSEHNDWIGDELERQVRTY